DPSYPRMVNRAFDKIRQAAGGMPAVIIRMLSALLTIVDETVNTEQRRVLLVQADAVWRVAQSTITEPKDSADIEAFYRRLVGRVDAIESPPPAHPAYGSSSPAPGRSEAAATALPPESQDGEQLAPDEPHGERLPSPSRRTTS
ncbi:MAG TPA: hypothetical protein VK386_02645, partial [Acidimicrobiales bacterium]|nr:hypothetical protein [Acidimicrobiales bacterium]